MASTRRDNLTLTTQPVTPFLPEYRFIKQLYYRSFPGYEQEAWLRLMFKRLFTRADFTAYYDGQQFVGFTYIVHHQGIHYLLYLAVNDQIRSRGYGSRILQQLNDTYAEDTLVLDIEQLDPSAANNHQRQRRLKFYQKNGFDLTNRLTPTPEVTYQMLSNTAEVNHAKVDDMFAWFNGRTFG